MVLISACQNKEIDKENENFGITNPASKYCVENKGQVKIIETEQGQKGICVLPNGIECDEWAFFRNECPNNSIENNNEIIALIYQPKQCEETPWEKWIKTSDIRWVKAPTEKEVITVYLSNAFNIELVSFEKIETDRIVCQACNVCPTTYYYEIKVKKSENIEKLKEIGFN